MVYERRPIRVTTDTDLPTLLQEAAKPPLLLERDGELFRLEWEDAIAYEPDAVLVRQTLAATAGSWANLDIDAVIVGLYEARQTGSRSPHRP